MGESIVGFRVDSRLRSLRALSPEVRRALKEEFTTSNPDFFKKKRMGFATWGVSPKLCSLDEHGGIVTLPRGGTDKVREVAARLGQEARFVDSRLVLPEVAWPEPRIELRWYQREALAACLQAEQGIVRLPTGSGKTSIALALAAATRQPTLVIMRDGNLLEQWRERAVRELGLDEGEVGVLRGKTRLSVGDRLTLALQQTLYSSGFPFEQVVDSFGAVLVDEVHGVAASTFQNVIDRFPARYRLGFSADESRKDRKEFLVYEQMGGVIYEVNRKTLEQEEIIHPVEVRLVPTGFEASWYRDAESGERDFNLLLERMIGDEGRERVLLELVRELVREGETPAFVFTHRVEHARQLADSELFGLGVRCGLMLGGDDNRQRFEEDKARLLASELDVAAGTFAAIGQGIDVPTVRAGIVATPFGQNRQFFGQVRGRVCRVAPGKTSAVLYVLWDRAVFPYLDRTLAGWNGGNTYVRSETGEWHAV